MIKKQENTNEINISLMYFSWHNIPRIEIKLDPINLPKKDAKLYHFTVLLIPVLKSTNDTLISKS